MYANKNCLSPLSMKKISRKLDGVVLDDIYVYVSPEYYATLTDEPDAPSPCLVFEALEGMEGSEFTLRNIKLWPEQSII